MCVILHSTQSEIRYGKRDEGHAEIEAVAKAAGARIVSTAEFMKADRSYRDDIHLNAAGQRDLAQAFKRCMEKLG